MNYCTWFFGVQIKAQCLYFDEQWRYKDAPEQSNHVFPANKYINDIPPPLNPFCKYFLSVWYIFYIHWNVRTALSTIRIYYIHFDTEDTGCLHLQQISTIIYIHLDLSLWFCSDCEVCSIFNPTISRKLSPTVATAGSNI